MRILSTVLVSLRSEACFLLDGTSIYLTRDIGGAIERYEKYKFDKMIYVVSSQQDLHLSQFFKVLELMGFPWAKDLVHVNYGLVQGMSTRKGTVVFLNEIIKEAGNVMHEQMQKNDPLGTQIWKLYSRAKTQLPNAERMENLTWRMMAMNMRRAELDRNKGYECRHIPLADRRLRAVRLSVHVLMRRFFCTGLLRVAKAKATN